MFTSSTAAVPAVRDVPRHVAIIMDGNGRWAKQRLLPRVAGHRKGVEAVRATVRAAIARGIEYLTLFAFSSENWRRPADEVSILMELFMRALEQIQKEHKTCHAVIVGGDDVSYGSKPADAPNWREKMLTEVGHQLDPTRTHFLGKVPYEAYKKVLQVSAVHTYLTYPFVLSWSMLEAMASGCLVLGSDTSSVREAIRHGESGLLVEPLNPGALALRTSDALSLPLQQSTELRMQASQHIRERWPQARGQWAVEDLIQVTKQPARSER